MRVPQLNEAVALACSLTLCLRVRSCDHIGKCPAPWVTRRLLPPWRLEDESGPKALSPNVLHEAAVDIFRSEEPNCPSSATIVVSTRPSLGTSPAEDGVSGARRHEPA